MQQVKKIAVIGSGISGLSCAWLLRHAYDVVVYEKNPVAGGHARTRSIDYDRAHIDVDTGFIVFNDRNYPHLNGLFRALGVAYHESDMSFAASIDNGSFEYSSKSLKGIFPTWQSLGDIRRYQMMRDYLKFSRHAKQFLLNPRTITLGDLIAASGVGDIFTRGFILPMGAAIWSCPLSTMLHYPAAAFVRFFDNHGLLDYHGQPQWYTVTGGSRRYVERITASLGERMRLGTGVVSVERHAESITVTDEAGQTATFDAVIFATHADQAHRIFKNPSANESSVIGAFKTQKNLAILHRDSSLMPRQKHCWASWVYLSQSNIDASPQLAVTYWMNLLQGIDVDKPLFVTLNPPSMPEESLIFDKHEFAHPVFDQAAIDAQKLLPEMNGKNRIYWCGAWQRYGFHEDGISSGVNVARLLGVTPPWV